MDKWLVLGHTQSSVRVEADHKFPDSLSPQLPLECSQYPPSKSHLAHMPLPGHPVAMWAVLLFQIFDARAEAGGGCAAFCLISSSITLMDLPVLANTEDLACLWIFHCITMLPINMWISRVLLPLEKDASEDICILNAALLFVSGRQIESQGWLEDRQHFHCGSYHASLLYAPLSPRNWPFCLESSQDCPVVCPVGKL